MRYSADIASASHSSSVGCHVFVRIARNGWPNPQSSAPSRSSVAVGSKKMGETKRDHGIRQPERTQPATAINRKSDDGWDPTSIAERETRLLLLLESTPSLVSRLRPHLQLLSRFCRDCTGPCSGISSGYLARDPSRKRLRRVRR